MSGQGSTIRRKVLTIFTVSVLFFLVFPIFIVVPISFSASPYLEFPPSGFSLRWYGRYFGDPVWLQATGRSLLVAFTTMFLTMVLSLPAAFALVRGKVRGLRWLERAMMAPMVVPHIIIAVAIFDLFGPLRMVGEWYSVAIAHVTIAIPFAVIILTAALREFDRGLEMAAIGLGASPLTAIRRITLPLLMPSMISASLVAFITSFDELVIAMFLTGPNMTLPKKMFDDIATEISPTIAAVSTLQMCLVLAAILVYVKYGKTPNSHSHI
jgi:putative spermidine/putrescine transport system permease protein